MAIGQGQGYVYRRAAVRKSVSSRPELLGRQASTLREKLCGHVPLHGLSRMLARSTAMFRAAIAYYCNFYTSRAGIKNNRFDDRASSARREDGLGVRLCVRV